MIERWPVAWGGLLRGGRGIRPRSGVGKITVVPVRSVDLCEHDGYAVRAICVQAVPQTPLQQYDADGWPSGYEPPDGLRLMLRAKQGYERERVVQQLKVAEDDSRRCTRCGRHPWYARWSDAKLAVVVAGIVGDEAAFDCLRGRLRTERNWTEQELRERVDPLRLPASSDAGA